MSASSIMASLIKRWESHKQKRQQRHRPRLEIVMDPSEEIISQSFSRTQSPMVASRSPSNSDYSPGNSDGAAPSFQGFLQRVPHYHGSECRRDPSRCAELTRSEFHASSRQSSTTSSERSFASPTLDFSKPPLPVKSPYRLSMGMHCRQKHTLDRPPHIQRS